jgi:hypothetical protein
MKINEFLNINVYSSYKNFNKNNFLHFKMNKYSN